MKRKFTKQVYVFGLCAALTANTIVPAFAAPLPMESERIESTDDFELELFETDDKGVSDASPSDAKPSKASPSDASPSDALKKEKKVEMTYLSDLDWKSAKVGRHQPMKDKTLSQDGKKEFPITLLKESVVEGTDPADKIVVYEKGVYAVAESELVYDIAGKGCTRFQSYVGVSYDRKDHTNGWGACGFQVYADDIELENIDRLIGRDKQGFIDVEIPVGTETLTLITTLGGGDSHSVWADAKLFQDPETLENLGKVSVSLDSIFLPVEGEAKLNVEAKLINGSKVDLAGEDVEVSYLSDEETVAMIDEEGLITGLADGTVHITCQVTKEGITREASIDLIIGKGDESTWIGTSPDGTQTVMFLMNQDGGVEFTAFENGKQVIDMSGTGIKTSLGDFTTGLTFVEKEEAVIEDSYKLIGAKTSQVETEATEMTLTFEKEEVEYRIIVRVYDDGFAFRYTVSTDEEGMELRISEESTGFQLPENSTSYTMKYTPYHEEPVDKKSNSQLTGTYDMPFLFETNGTWVLISEAHVTGEYCGASMTGRGKGLVDVDFAPEQNKDVVTKVPFQSPWRFAVIGDPATINENTMAENLSPACNLEDTSWIQPGVTSWTWLNREGTRDYETYKRYVDLSAEMGWEYLLLDDGWQPGNWVNGYRDFYPWTKDLIAYAEEKGVGLLVWANHADLNTEEKMGALKVWADMGIKGIKIDFFNSQEQHIMKIYDMLQEKTAECKLLLNPHGANKTTGERRTWPQSLTREGILGAEQHIQGGKKALTAEYNCMVPFIRNAVGPADYTPLMSYLLVDQKAFTVSHMAANALVYESGIQCLADRDYIYLDSPTKSLLKNLPVSWDESHLLDGYPGEYVNIARRSGEDWYVGILCNEQRDAEVPLDFLNPGQTYYATIYKDGAKNTDVDVEMAEVTSEDVLTIPLAATGGASVKILSVSPTQPETIILSESEITLEQYQNVELTAAVSPEDTDMDQISWKSSDEAIATVINGKITALKPGIAEITASTGFNNAITATCKVTVQWPKYQVNETEWAISRGNAKTWKLNSENSITITSEGGEYGQNVATAKNVFFKDVQGDFSVSTKLDFEPGANYQSAGIILYANDKAVFEVLRRSHSGFGGRIFATVNINGSNLKEQTLKDTYIDTEVYLKLTRKGTSCTAFYSTDNEKWIPIGTSADNGGFSEDNLKVGIYAVNGEGRSGEIPATFENFVYEKDGKAAIVPFGIETDIEFEELKMRLYELIESCNQYEEIDYTADSYERLQTALETAKTGLAEEDVTKEDVEGYYTELSAAIDELVEVDVEFEELKLLLDKLIKSCEQYGEIDYTADSYGRLVAAIKAAKDGLANEAATKEDVKGYHTDLSDAIAGLVKVDKELGEVKDLLNSLIETCDQYKEADYTADSYGRLVAAIKAAKDGLASETATKEELKGYHTDLSDAIAGLVKVDKELEEVKDLLNSLIETCDQYEEADYTADSYGRLVAAIKAAKDGLASETVTKEELKGYHTDLSDAIAGLVKKENSNNTNGDSSNGGSGAGSASDQKGTVTNDPQKGKVNSITGIITGTGVGYSNWNFDEKGWKLIYADGTKAAGRIVTDESGTHEIGQWEMINGAWYNFGIDGYAKDGLIFDYVLGGYFYIDINSGMKTGWQQLEGKWYYFNPVSDGTKGKMAVNTTIQGYRVDEKGAWVE